uniref:Uncharacterized protein n=1 Tax=Graphocephala atropunctata TaxID=36148 RepID=A0A1B6MV80_9HEMI
MAEASDVPMEEAAASETSNTPVADVSAKETAIAETDVSAKETAIAETMVDSSGDNGDDKNDDGKGKYTEEERMKRKAYFKQIREKRRLAREKYRQNYVKRFGSRQSMSSIKDNSTQKDIIISFNMTEEDKKMLDFYKVRLSTLKSENEQLHRRLAYLIKENMRVLQMGPSMTPAAFNA